MTEEKKTKRPGPPSLPQAQCDAAVKALGILKGKHKTDIAVGRVVNVSGLTINRILVGGGKEVGSRPSALTFAKIARAMGMTEEELAAGDFPVVEGAES